MIRAYGYARTATVKQAKEANSIEEQVSRIEKHCKNKNIKLIDIFSDSCLSGVNTLNNSALEEMLSDCLERDSIDAIIITDSDRISRNETDYFFVKNSLESKGVELIEIGNRHDFVEVPPMEAFVNDIIEAVHEYESRIARFRQKHI